MLSTSSLIPPPGSRSGGHPRPLARACALPPPQTRLFLVSGGLLLGGLAFGLQSPELALALGSLWAGLVWAAHRLQS